MIPAGPTPEEDASYEALTEEALSEEGAPMTAAARRDRTRLWRLVSVGLVFGLVYGLLLAFYRPDLMLSNTITSGGDMGAHHYAAKYMIDVLVPSFHLTGWTMGWYAGMPLFTFYLPLPFLMIAIFNFVLPYGVSFKLATVLGVFLLPLAAYLLGRLFRFREPFPLLAAVMSLAFLFSESFSIYGGNILSTLAGEFGYSLAFALIFIFLGTLYRGMERGRFDWLFAVNALILMGVVLSHIVATIVLIIIVPSFLLVHRTKKAFVYLAGVFFVGFLLTAFWGLPFVDKLSWTAHMSWGQLTLFKDLLPPELRPVAALGVVGMAFALAKRDVKTLPLLWIVVFVVALFFTLPDGRLWNGRLVPFMYFTICLWAAYGLAWLFRAFSVMLEDLLGAGPRVSRLVYSPVIAATMVAIIFVMSGTAAGWIKWNYSGYEAKEPWPRLEEILKTIDELPPGRVMWEHSPSLDKFGTPRVFELIPFWTSHPTMEGTLMESAFTAPYHFVNQGELSMKPSHAIIGVDYPPRNTAAGLTHLAFMNIPYLLTVSPEVTLEVEADPRADLIAKIDDVSIFRVSGSEGYVQVARNLPLKVKTDDWRGTIVPWYKNLNALPVPIIWDRGEKGLDQFESIDRADVANPPATPIEGDGAVLSEQIENDRISFETTAIGKPHLIKVSYFPNWKVKGADGPYVVSPSFMMVIPRQREVTLYYGRTASNVVGQAFTIVGWLIVVAVLAAEVLRRRRRNGGHGPSDRRLGAPPSEE
ncbi:MAG TPA: hypothetical protein VFE20_05010 [Thermoleophilia bacterium]|nr:hypothetical protein [Thermoleophilia bacterium]